MLYANQGSKECSFFKSISIHTQYSRCDLGVPPLCHASSCAEAPQARCFSWRPAEPAECTPGPDLFHSNAKFTRYAVLVHHVGWRINVVASPCLQFTVGARRQCLSVDPDGARACALRTR